MAMHKHTRPGSRRRRRRQQFNWHGYTCVEFLDVPGFHFPPVHPRERKWWTFYPFFSSSNQNQNQMADRTRGEISGLELWKPWTGAVAGARWAAKAKGKEGNAHHGTVPGPSLIVGWAMDVESRRPRDGGFKVGSALFERIFYLILIYMY